MPIQPDTAENLVNEITSLHRSIKNLANADLRTRLPLALGGVLHALCGSGECRSTELAHQLGVNPSVLSRQLAELMQLELINKRPDPLDGRAWLVSISPAGRQLLAEVAARRSVKLRELLVDWDESEAQLAVSTVSKLARSFQQSAGQGRPAPRTLPSAIIPSELIPSAITPGEIITGAAISQELSA